MYNSFKNISLINFEKKSRKKKGFIILILYSRILNVVMIYIFNNEEANKNKIDSFNSVCVFSSGFVKLLFNSAIKLQLLILQPKMY